MDLTPRNIFHGPSNPSLVSTDGKPAARKSLRQRIAGVASKRRLEDDGSPEKNKENVGSGRNQALINKRHAKVKADQLLNLKEQVIGLELERGQLRRQVEVLILEKKALQRECAQLLESQNDFRSKWIEATKTMEVLKLKSAEDELSLLKAKGFPSIRKETNSAALKEMVSKALLAVMAVAMAYTKPVTRLRVVADVLLQNFLFGVDATSSIFTSLVRKFVRSSVFVPWKILKAMDLALKGSLNYRGIETLRQVEGLAPWEQGLLLSRSAIQSQAKKLYLKGQEVIPIQAVDCPLGEMFQFDYERKLRLILKTFGLDTVAQNSTVEISITLDGAELCDYKSHLTAGIKVTDRRAIDPRTNIPLCSETGKVY